MILGDHRDPSVQLRELFGRSTVEGSGADSATAVPNSVRPAIVWGHGVIEAAGITADQQLLTIKALRDAEPRLDGRPALHLAKLLLIA
jgi:hypothetical protein